MTKVSTIASLVRIAARSEPEFTETVNNVFEEGDTERIWEFFDRLNIPRSQGGENLDAPLVQFESAACLKIWDFATERRISSGIQRFLDRHERKIKWHATHPSMEGIENVLLLVRASIVTTNLRLRRVRLLMKSKDELTPIEWSIVRVLMNRSYLSFRNFLDHMAGDWVDAMLNAVPRDEFATAMGSFYEFVDTEVCHLEEIREVLEERRMEMTVLPEGYPPVKPPNYFGGDLLSRGPWIQYWNRLNTRAHHFRESIG